MALVRQARGHQQGRSPPPANPMAECSLGQFDCYGNGVSFPQKIGTYLTYFLKICGSEVTLRIIRSRWFGDLKKNPAKNRVIHISFPEGPS